MQKRFYDKESINKLIVVNKPIFMSSNFYLTRIKKKYKNKKAGFSGTLDPFAKGCLIVAFGQYSKLFIIGFEEGFFPIVGDGSD